MISMFLGAFGHCKPVYIWYLISIAFVLCASIYDDFLRSLHLTVVRFMFFQRSVMGVLSWIFVHSLWNLTDSPLELLYYRYTALRKLLFKLWDLWYCFKDTLVIMFWLTCLYFEFIFLHLFTVWFLFSAS